MSDQHDMPGLGHNIPPTAEQDLKTELRGTTADYTKRVLEIAQAVEGYPEKITDEETAEHATLLVGQISEMIKALDAMQDDSAGPYNKALGIIGAHFRAVGQGLANAKVHLTGLIDGWIAAETARRDAQRRALLVEAEERAKKAAKPEDVEKVEEVAAQAQAVKHPKRVRSGFGQTASRRTNQYWEVKDFAKIPRGYLEPNAGKIRRAMLAGTPIPGIMYGTTQGTVVKS